MIRRSAELGVGAGGVEAWGRPAGPGVEVGPAGGHGLCRVAPAALSHELTEGILTAGLWCQFSRPLLDIADQHFQRIGRSAGVQIEHESMLVAGDGPQAEDLRRNRLLQVDEQLYRSGRLLRQPDAGHIGVVRPDFAH